MSHLRLLVVEGNAAAIRHACRTLSGATPGERYAEELKRLRPGAIVDIVAPADHEPSTPLCLSAYHGIAITGSSLNAYSDAPEVLRQVDYARAIFRSGTPFFGSGWGLQIAAVAAGGRVARNPRGREVLCARDLYLTAGGRDHPMHAGRPPAFSAPAINGDHVIDLPPGALVTAANATSAVQAAEIRFEGGCFWGTQYHPEYSLADIADVLARYGYVLVDEGNFETLDGLQAYVSDLRRFAADPALVSIAWRCGLGPDLLNPSIRLTEISNWLTHAVDARARETQRMAAPIRAVVSDLDGVVYRGDAPIPGAVEAIADWARRGIPYMFVTNNASKTAEAFAAKLRGFGVAADASQVLTSADAAASYLAGHFRKGITTFVVGEPVLFQAVERTGATIVEDEVAEVVVFGFDYDLTYEKMRTAINALLKGAALIVTNPDTLSPVESGVEPCVGTFLAALLAAVPQAVPIVTGKPSPVMIREALRRLGTRPEETIMVGDQIATDILAGQSAGLRSFLISTGVRSASHPTVRADADITSLAEIPVV